MLHRRWPLIVLCLVMVAQTGAAAAQDLDLPHVIVVLADDLGYGDVGPLNTESSIPTPAFDRLADEGITFTDAHTPSAVCTPTRYGLLTGRYCWRSRLKRGVLNGYGEPLIESDRPTLASVLKSGGYQTAVVGKWHLGLGLHSEAGKSVQQGLDLTRALSHYPATVGFDHSLVIPASLDFPPYVYFRDGQATSTETVAEQASGFPKFWRQGPRAVDFDLRGCLDRLTDEATGIIAAMKDAPQPQFLYFPLTAPHKPVFPSEKFAGTSELGPYGDFVRQVDDVIGRVLDAIDSADIADQCLVVVTSDNGSFMYQLPPDQADHLTDETVQGFHPTNHRSNLNWRGTKADIWEAGHRVPFFVRLPGARHGGSRVGHVVGLVDLMATLADHLGIRTDESAGPDSVSFASLLADPNASFDRAPLICHSASGMFAIRDGRWKLVAGNGSGGREKPKGTPFGEPWALFDLDADPSETTDVSGNNPQVMSTMKSQLMAIKGDD